MLLTVGGFVGYRLTFAGPGQAQEQEKPQSVVLAEQKLKAFMTAWRAGDWQAAGRLTDNPEGATSLLTSVGKNLKPSPFEITVGEGHEEAGSSEAKPVVVPFTVRMTVPKIGPFTYESKARVVESVGSQVVEFKSSMVHPDLRPGQTLAVAKVGTRGSILDRTGAQLTAGSLVGTVDAEGEGASGLQERYNDQLGGSGQAYAIAITDRDSGKALRPLSLKAGARAGTDVKTTIDPRVQEAAAAALEGADVPASLVAIKPSTGEILAVANRPGGFNRALVGKYPPGSTFKVVTAAALLESGMSPSDRLACPTYEWVNGYRFANQDEFSLGSSSTFRQAFARSCNTAFIASRDHIDDSTLATTASAFGIGGEWDTGASTYDGSVPENTDVNDKAASMIGQARVLTSPLVMASVAATVKSGTFVQPRLVPAAVKHPYEAPRSLSPDVVRNLRSMMRSVVTEGAGKALRGIPGEPHAKTGTAEFGDDKPPQTHAWMIGYQGDSDLAWAVLLEGGGSGGHDAGPIAAKFLQQLTAGGTR
ncbi:penicillin-binding protein [Flindersiella endophytica]